MASGWSEKPKTFFRRGRGSTWKFRGRGRGFSNTFVSRSNDIRSPSNSPSSIDLQQLAVPHNRAPGASIRKKVVVDVGQWENELRKLKKEIGDFRVIGFDVECINQSNEKQIQRSENEGNYFYNRRKMETDKCNESSRSSASLSDNNNNGNDPLNDIDHTSTTDTEEESDEGPQLPKPKTEQKRHPEVVVLLQMATWTGYVVLFRICFFKEMPQSLLNFLADPTYLKVGVSIDEDGIRLLDDWGITLKGWIDLRNVYAETALVYRFQEDCLLKMGLKHMATRVFGSRSAPMSPKMMRLMAWSNWNCKVLSSSQINYASWDAQIALDLFSFFTQRLCNVNYARRYDEEYFKEVYEKCRKNIEYPGSSRYHENSENEENDFYAEDGIISKEPDSEALAANVSVDQKKDQKPFNVDAKANEVKDSAIIRAGPPMRRFNDRVIDSTIGPDGIAVLTISNPPMNLLDITTLRLLKANLQKFEEVDSCKGIIITADRSVSKAFTVGFDLEELTRNSADDRLTVYIEALISLWLHIYKSRLATVALINGMAVGGGGILAAFCDRRVISQQNGSIAFNESQLGITLPSCIIKRFIQLIGFHKTECLLTTSAFISPKDAYESGLVDRVVSDDSELWNAAVDELRLCMKNSDSIIHPIKMEIRRRLIYEFMRDRQDIIDRMVDEIRSERVQKVLRDFISRKKR